MYPVGVFLFLAVIDMFMTWYGVVEKGADYYKDLIALGIAAFMTVYLSLACVSGTVMLTDTTQLNDAGLMWLGFIIAIAQGIILLLEYIEAREDREAQKQERLIS